MTAEQLDAATAYTEKAIQDCAAHYSLLMVGYEELAAEHQRRQDRETNLVTQARSGSPSAKRQSASGGPSASSGRNRLSVLTGRKPVS